jgi:hypothetical protein
MKTSLFIGIILLCSKSFGQQSEKFSLKNSVEFELFGHGSFYSIDYERIFLNKEKIKTLGQVGIAYYPESTGVMPLWIPLSVNQLISFHSNHLEFGAGQIIHLDNGIDGKKEMKLFGSLKLGYRYQKPDGKFLYKVAFTPFIDYWDTLPKSIIQNANVNFVPWAGMAFGYNF